MWTAVVEGWTLRWLHTGTLYERTRDPEGLLSTLPALATTLLGAVAGLWMRGSAWSSTNVGTRRRARLLLAGAGLVLIVAGEVWSHWFPINKNLWTSSYVLLMAGIATVLLSLLSVLFDRPQPWESWRRALAWPWLVFGANAIAAYALSGFLVETFSWFKHTDAQGHAHSWWSLAYTDVFARGGSNDWTSLAFAVCFVVVCFLPEWWLWQKRIWLKL